MDQFQIFFFTLTAFALLSTCHSFSQEPAVAQYDEYQNYTDTTNKILNANFEKLKIDLRLPSKDVLSKYKNDSNFNYEHKKAENEDWIAKITNWFNQQFRSIRYSKAYSTALDIFYYGLIIFALIIIIWGLIKSDKGFFFLGKSVNSEINLIEQKEDINQLNFDQLITSAIENKHYKLAVRYLFLKSLKLLSDNGIIDYKKDKTNYQYAAEIKDMQLARTFGEASYRFDWIWYGDFPIDDNLMNNSKNEFDKLYKLLKSQ
jgi:hypothetical protein